MSWYILHFCVWWKRYRLLYSQELIFNQFQKRHSTLNIHKIVQMCNIIIFFQTKIANLCTFYLIVSLYVCDRGRSTCRRGWGWGGVILTGLTPPHVCHVRSWISNFIRCGICCVQWFEVRGERWLLVLLILVECFTITFFSHSQSCVLYCSSRLWVSHHRMCYIAVVGLEYLTDYDT
jgi:hypothetical protein